MNAKQLIAAVAVLAASSAAFAVEGHEYPHPADGFVSTKTRAEVAAEVKQAYTDGSLVTNDASPSKVTTAGTARSRADVRAEGVQSVKNRKIDVGNIYFGS